MAKKQSSTVTEARSITITPPDFGYAVVRIIGNAPLVVHRFSQKTKMEMAQKAVNGGAAKKKVREPQRQEDVYNAARYISPEGWDGFPCGAVRAAVIRAAKLAGLEMVMARCSFFVLPDGRDRDERQVDLVRIYGEPVMQLDMARVETGAPYVAIRPAYYEWYADVRVRFDQGQISLEDVTNLLVRAGIQVGICEGRPFSKKGGPGMGWGTFDLEAAVEIDVPAGPSRGLAMAAGA